MCVYLSLSFDLLGESRWLCVCVPVMSYDLLGEFHWLCVSTRHCPSTCLASLDGCVCTCHCPSTYLASLVGHCPSTCLASLVGHCPSTCLASLVGGVFTLFFAVVVVPLSFCFKVTIVSLQKKLEDVCTSNECASTPMNLTPPATPFSSGGQSSQVRS